MWENVPVGLSKSLLILQENFHLWQHLVALYLCENTMQGANQNSSPNQHRVQERCGQRAVKKS